MKHTAQQFEIGFASEPFALVAEKAPDFAKIQAEARRREFDQVQAAKAQTTFLCEHERLGPWCPKCATSKDWFPGANHDAGNAEDQKAFDQAQAAKAQPDFFGAKPEATGLCDHDKPANLCPFCN